jgi:predicted dehydrogenase
VPKIRVGVAGAGTFGRHHLRVLRSMERAELAGVVDIDPNRAAAAATEFGCARFDSLEDLAGRCDAAIVAVPTTAHADIGAKLLDAGVDVLVEKPIAPDVSSARRLIETATRRGRLLQVGHLERYNPAVEALCRVSRLPLFFEIHRLSLFTPRSLDVDVVLDLMIHDIDIVLTLTAQRPAEVRAAGLSILSRKVDIANVRLAFANGCTANFTASRVSTEQVRKLRMFQPHQYFSLDYRKQELLSMGVSPERQLHFQPVAVESQEPLRRELEDFIQAVETRARPRVDGEQALRALEVALEILDKIKENAELVAQSVSRATLSGPAAS